MPSSSELNSCVSSSVGNWFHCMLFCLVPKPTDDAEGGLPVLLVNTLTCSVLVNPQKGGDVYRGRKKATAGVGGTGESVCGGGTQAHQGTHRNPQTAPMGAQHCRADPGPGPHRSWDTPLLRRSTTLVIHSKQN